MYVLNNIRSVVGIVASVPEAKIPVCCVQLWVVDSVVLTGISVLFNTISTRMPVYIGLKFRRVTYFSDDVRFLHAYCVKSLPTRLYAL